MSPRFNFGADPFPNLCQWSISKYSQSSQILFAGDTTSLNVAKSDIYISCSAKKVSSESAKNWFSTNKLIMNANKT